MTLLRHASALRTTGVGLSVLPLVEATTFASRTLTCLATICRDSATVVPLCVGAFRKVSAETDGCVLKPILVDSDSSANARFYP
jgi:hypothetical protein